MKRTRPLLALIMLFLFTQPAKAWDCMRLCNPSFIKQASPLEIENEISKGASLTAINDEGLTALHVAASFGTANSVKTLIISGAEVNIPDITGRIPLHDASAMGNIETIQTLLDAGADPSIHTNQGHTPYQLARKLETLQGTKALELLKQGQ